MNFPDQLRMLVECFRVLILLNFSNFLGWFIQALINFLPDVILNVVDLQANGILKLVCLLKCLGQLQMAVLGMFKLGNVRCSKPSPILTKLTFF